MCNGCLAGNGDHWRADVKPMTSMVTQIAGYFWNCRELLLTQAEFGFLNNNNNNNNYYYYYYYYLLLLLLLRENTQLDRS
jgi:hypothetical protein